MGLLEITDVIKRFPSGATAVNGVTLSVAQGEIVCLLGPSGCGKTTLLRIVAGLEQPDRGSVFFAGRNLAETPVHQRNFGLMFQEFALFPDKSVAQNIAFGLRMAGLPSAQTAQRVDEMLELVGLQGYNRRTIFALSGGERQRVALARSLAPRPRLLMLDEPLGSLDRTLREELMMELRAILKRLHMTALYVTHDQQEALAVADRVAVMNQGHLVQDGTPREIYHRPATPFVAGFLGFTNHFPAQVEKAAPQYANTALGRIGLAEPAAPGQYTFLVRPNALTLYPDPGEQNQLTGVVDKVSFRGNHIRLEIVVDQKWRLTFETPSDFALGEGESLRFAINPAACMLFPVGGPTAPAPTG